MDTPADRDLRQLSNCALFARYLTGHRGVLIERDHGAWDIWPVDEWDDAAEAERRSGANGPASGRRPATSSSAGCGCEFNQRGRR